MSSEDSARNSRSRTPSTKQKPEVRTADRTVVSNPGEVPPILEVPGAPHAPTANTEGNIAPAPSQATLDLPGVQPPVPSTPEAELKPIPSKSAKGKGKKPRAPSVSPQQSASPTHGPKADDGGEHADREPDAAAAHAPATHEQHPTENPKLLSEAGREAVELAPTRRGTSPVSPSPPISHPVPYEPLHPYKVEDPSALSTRGMLQVGLLLLYSGAGLEVFLRYAAWSEIPSLIPISFVVCGVVFLQGALRKSMSEEEFDVLAKPLQKLAQAISKIRRGK